MEHLLALYRALNNQRSPDDPVRETAFTLFDQFCKMQQSLSSLGQAVISGLELESQDAQALTAAMIHHVTHMLLTYYGSSLEASSVLIRQQVSLEDLDVLSQFIVREKAEREEQIKREREELADLDDFPF